MTANGEKMMPSPPPDGPILSQFKTPLSRGGLASGWYRLKWIVGYRLIGPASWTRAIRRRLSYEAWVLSHVKGWFLFLLWRIGLRIPFKASVAGIDFRVTTPVQRIELSRRIRETYDPFPFQEETRGENSGVFRLNFMGRPLVFHYDGDRYGTLLVLKEFFVAEPYARLKVEGLDVLDVGASFGDTPVYFAARGARRVIALEPYPATFARARLNVTANGCDDRVILLNEGAGGSGLMRLTRKPVNLWANAVPSADGEEIRFNTLREMIARFGIDKAALKLHGEGCEYALLEEASNEDLAHFPQIVLKYHYGGRRVAQRLEKAGFRIMEQWDLHFSYNENSSIPRYEAGMIWAKMP